MTVRIPVLLGGLNFRDLGGYASEDGRSARWNILYRSGTTHALTTEDLKLLVGYGIRHVFDFRSATERREYPSRLAEVPASITNFATMTKLRAI
jgi:protein-tyrosine phosphatase